jgi:uncharacterized protein DUF547
MPATRNPIHTVPVIALVALGVAAAAAPRAQDSLAGRRAAFDLILDTNVRDGNVYYRALKEGRGKLDAFVGTFATVDADKLSKDEQIAFWLNAYDAIVLRTVIDHYPIPRRSAEYPPNSIRQIPGAFERLTHPVAGRMLTLDQIEQTVLAKFNDPRLYFAIGRGAVGGGRLRSEAYTPDKLEAQLAEVADECAMRGCVQADSVTNKLHASAIFSWHEQEFVRGYADKALPVYASRAPIERAILAFIQPRLLTTERDFLEMNTFQLVYKPFDWSLNDLTGRSGYR